MSTSCSSRADTIAKIFQREIKKWNDTAIAADNPGVKLPDADIVVAHRADGSGTTEQLHEVPRRRAAPATWKLKSGSTVEWPADTQAGQGNGGVAQIVKSTKGAIGYVDLSDAKASGLKYASVKNQAGKYVEPTTASAPVGRRRHRGQGQPDLFSALNAKGDAAYPITAPDAGCIVYAKQADKAKARGAQGLPQVPGHRRPEAASRHRLRARCRRALQDKALAQVDKIQG